MPGLRRLQHADKPSFSERIRHFGSEKPLDDPDNPDNPAEVLRAFSQAKHFHDLACVDMTSAGATTLMSIFRSQPQLFSLRLCMLELPPLGSQAFMPLTALPCLVMVAPGQSAPRLQNGRCFVAGPGQGVNQARGAWHHLLLSLHETTDFLVVNRGGPEINLDKHALAAHPVWISEAS